MFLDNGIYLGQPQAQALLFAADKGQMDSGQQFLRNADACILNLKTDMGLMLRRVYANTQAAAVGHGVQAVDHQVEQHLTNPVGVTQNTASLPGLIHKRTDDAPRGTLGSDKFQRFTHQGVQLEVLQIERGGLGKRQKLGNESVDAIDFINDKAKAKQLETELERFSAALSWVNPKERTERGADNLDLDDVLLSIAQKGVFVSTHPEVILKIGTKEVLYSTRNMDWGGDIELYSDYEDFEKRFISSLDSSSVRILKQYRGESGRGIFKVRLKDFENKTVSVVHAVSANEEQLFSKDEFHQEFKKYVLRGVACKSAVG